MSFRLPVLPWVITMAFASTTPVAARQPPPKPIGRLIDIGGQLLHVSCTGRGSPVVILESGTGDVSVIWGLVQPKVSEFTTVCSYDRGGYAWSQPGNRPRTFSQLALELRTALGKVAVRPPYVVVGQSYGGLVVRGFAARYPDEVRGMVLVDAVHEDQRVVYGGQPHRIRDGAQGRPYPTPRIALDRELLAVGNTRLTVPPDRILEAPLDRLPAKDQSVWRWSHSLRLIELAQSAELDWSPEELSRFHRQRLDDRATLGDLPLVVLARTDGGYPDGMEISADSLERERRTLQADLAALSRRGVLRYAARSGHNIHVEDPDLVVAAIREVVAAVRPKHP